MPHPLLLGLAASLALPALAQAASCPPDATVFACTTTKGRQVEVCDAGRVIQYRYGRPGAAAEMALAIPREQASTHQWNGIGRNIAYSVRIPNGDTVYEVFKSFDRLGAADALSAGINVEVAGRTVASIPCRTETLSDSLEGIDLPARE